MTGRYCDLTCSFLCVKSAGRGQQKPVEENELKQKLERNLLGVEKRKIMNNSMNKIMNKYHTSDCHPNKNKSPGPGE